MKKIVMVVLFLLLAGCVQTNVYDSSYISEEDVIAALQHVQIPVTPTSKRGGELFTSTLNAVKPSVYDMDKQTLIIYVFENTEQRADGEWEFTEQTASMNVVSYKAFTKRNVWLLYVHGEELNAPSIPYVEDIESALESLVEG